MMPTHGLWIIICCKHHGEIICFVSKQGAAICIFSSVSRLRDQCTLAIWATGGCFACYKSPRHCSPSLSWDSCHLNVFAISQLSLCCSCEVCRMCGIVWQPAACNTCVYCLQQYMQLAAIIHLWDLHTGHCSTADIAMQSADNIIKVYTLNTNTTTPNTNTTHHYQFILITIKD